MKLSSVIWITLISICFSFRLSNERPRYFEGVITYKLEAVTNSKRIDSATLVMIVSKESQMYFKLGNMLNKNFKSTTPVQLFNVKENRIYSQKVWTDTIF